MKIQARITALTAGVIVAVVAGTAAQLAFTEGRRVRHDSERRVEAVMEGVFRIARESLNAGDELMLLSYLKFLMRENPEVEVATVSRAGYSSVLGQVRTELFYRTVTLTSSDAGVFKAAGAVAAAADPTTLPPGTITVQLGYSKSAIERQVAQARLGAARRILGVAAVGLLLGVAGALWVGRRLAAPVQALAEAADAVGAGRLETQVQAAGSDEVADLSRRFNEMASRLRELLQSKEDLMGTLSHEMRTPLTGLRGFLEYIEDPSRGEKERAEALVTMHDAVTQMELSLTNAMQLLRSGARPPLKIETISLNDVVAEAVRLFVPAARSNGVTLAGPAGPPIQVRGDRDLLRRVAVNLVSNGVLYTPPGGAVLVRVAQQEGEILLTVSDDGPGVAAVDRERIFEKFYRVPGADGRSRRIPGSGLGLAIAKQAVAAHGGRIWVESEPGRGSNFHVALPKQGVPS